MTPSRIALDAGALTILPIVMIAQSLQFRRDRMFESFLRNPSTRELGSALVVSLAISVLAYFAMAAGWFGSIIELEQGRDHSWSDICIVVGLIAAVVALTRGGINALVVSYRERGDVVRRELATRRDRGSHGESEKPQEVGEQVVRPITSAEQLGPEG
jgi:hypothetical protein